MLLHAALRPRGEGLRDLAPRAPRVPQRLQPLLLRRRPGRVRAPFLRHGTGELLLLLAGVVVRRVLVRAAAHQGRGGVAECGAGVAAAGACAAAAGEVEVGDAAFARVGGGWLLVLEGWGLGLGLVVGLLREVLRLELLGPVLGVLGEGEARGVVGLRGRVGVVVLIGVAAQSGGGEVGGEGEVGWGGRVGALG